jgi:hypothetical protein
MGINHDRFSETDLYQANEENKWEKNSPNYYRGSVITVYVTGPYTVPDPDVNTVAAISIANSLLDLGFAPFVPHFSHYWNRLFPRDYEEWMQLDFTWLSVCNAMFWLPGISSGRDRESALAVNEGIPIFDDLNEIDQFFLERKRLNETR